jgi:hypothetical protein
MNQVTDYNAKKHGKKNILRETAFRLHSKSFFVSRSSKIGKKNGNEKFTVYSKAV